MKKIISLMMAAMFVITACKNKDDVLPGGSLRDEYVQSNVTNHVYLNPESVNSL